VEEGEIPDAAAVIAALEAASDKKVEMVVGKPSRHMVQAALEVLGLSLEECAMVGDRLETDMVMAKENGFLAILTLTGVSSRNDLPFAPVAPDHVIESVAELPTLDLELGGG
jgi:ribonucleotide monophosphatase NagD (HAD superfamily)